MTEIDLKAERMTLKQAAELLGVDLSTAWRYTLRGVRVRETGERVVLASWRIGGKRFTTVEAVHEFVAAQQPPTDGKRRGRPAKSAKRRAKAAEKKLDRIGL